MIPVERSTLARLLEELEALDHHIAYARERLEFDPPDAASLEMWRRPLWFCQGQVRQLLAEEEA